MLRFEMGLCGLPRVTDNGTSRYPYAGNRKIILNRTNPIVPGMYPWDGYHWYCIIILSY